ncbi:phage tail assembly protein T [Burkholderia vietnamiensis]|uniref:phage tail assembly protein T n=2 Tax=Burkholderia vietnamiensis TaxID=60552 RepID=UPI003C7C3B27
MTSAEFVEWMAFFDMEPWGSHIDDLRAGTIASMVANVNRDTEKRPDPYEPLHFITWNDRRASEKEPEPILLDDPEAQSQLILMSMSPAKHG